MCSPTFRIVAKGQRGVEINKCRGYGGGEFDGYRMHARLDRGAVKLLTRTGLDWTHKYPPIAAAVSGLRARQAYLDGELCGVFPDGITSFGMIQGASDAGTRRGWCTSSSTLCISTAKMSALGR
jgi:hypothetical protein